MDPVARAQLALEGLSVADALGGFFEMAKAPRHAVRTRTAPAIRPWYWTDDTQMAAALVEILAAYGTIDQDALAARFAIRYERWRGYGAAARQLLRALGEGGDWRTLAPAIHQGQGSWGNGSAMRVAPLGAFFADDPAQLVAQARAQAEVTHAHPEAVAGAIAVAAAAAAAWSLRTKRKPDPNLIFAAALDATPPGRVRDGILAASHVPAATSAFAAGQILGNGVAAACHDTVPLALWLAAHNLKDYPNAVWGALEALGDCDTTAAIAGGIIVLCAGLRAIPSDWRAAREPLPAINGPDTPSPGQAPSR